MSAMTNPICINDAEDEQAKLKSLDTKGVVWINGGEKPSEYQPSKQSLYFEGFPYFIDYTEDGELCWGYLDDPDI